MGIAIRWGEHWGVESSGVGYIAYPRLCPPHGEIKHWGMDNTGVWSALMRGEPLREESTGVWGDPPGLAVGRRKLWW